MLKSIKKKQKTNNYTKIIQFSIINNMYKPKTLCQTSHHEEHILEL